MLHRGFDWPTIPGLSLEYIISLGRCGTPGAFYDMLQVGLDTEHKCVFCHPELLKGEIIYENDSCFAFIPPGEFNRHQGVLASKFVIVLKRHTANPVLTDAEALAMNRCRGYLQKEHDCYAEESGGANYTRWGTAIYNGGTVIGHLHENVDTPNGQGEVRPAVYKNQKGWEKDYSRLCFYHNVYRDGLSREEFIDKYELACKGL